MGLVAGIGLYLHGHSGSLSTAGSIGSPSEVRSTAFWDASLPDLEHRPQAFRQWRGKVVVVNFWAPWCPPCRNEIPGFMRLHDRLGGRELQFVGIALDSDENVRAFVDETGMDYPVLTGGMQAVELSQLSGNRLGGLPYTVIFDRHGHAVATLTGEVSEARLEAIVTPLL